MVLLASADGPLLRDAQPDCFELAVHEDVPSQEALALVVGKGERQTDVNEAVA